MTKTKYGHEVGNAIMANDVPETMTAAEIRETMLADKKERNKKVLEVYIELLEGLKRLNLDASGHDSMPKITQSKINQIDRLYALRKRNKEKMITERE